MRRYSVETSGVLLNKISDRNIFIRVGQNCLRGDVWLSIQSYRK